MFKLLQQSLKIRRYLSQPGNEETGFTSYLVREKILVFAISAVLAFCLWFIVNLSRDFNISIALPIEVENLPDDMAIIGDVPETARVGVTGEGWKLIPIYNNPPEIRLDLSGGGEINLFEKVQQQMSILSGLSVINVDPLSLNLQIEEKASRMVPVVPRVDIQLRERYGILSDPVFWPDSVRITGSSTQIREVERVETEQRSLEDVRTGSTLELSLIRPSSGIVMEPPVVSYIFEVTEFTEGEISIPVRIRNLPAGRAVTFNPSSVRVRYDVPIGQFSQVQSIRPFIAWVEYAEIEQDTTGFVTPQLERMAEEYDIQVRNIQPSKISYFNVLE
ncbi:MAG: CdaR family protein [Balneolaceae bacterium]